MSTVLSKSPKLDDRFISNIKGKDFVLYAGVLDLAHQKGLKSITVEPVQYPTKENGMEGICKAFVESSDGQCFVELGDANPKNVNSMIREHILRMAATRAKARALRDFTNIGITCLEELGDLDQVAGDTGKSEPVTKPRLKAVPTPTRKGSNDEKSDQTDNQKPGDSKTAEKTSPVQKTLETKSGQPTGTRQPPISMDGQPKVSTAQKRAILSLAQRRGVREDDLTLMIEEMFNSSLDYLAASEASALIRQLQQAA